MSAAIGTEKQFRKQEQAVYQMALIRPKFSNNLSQSTDLDAQRLVASLSALGTAAWNERVAYDKRKEEQDTMAANKIWQETSSEDREKLSAMELLAKYGEGYHASDSSYAVAKLDEMRGGYISSKLKQEYLETVLPQDENPPKTAQENIARYEKYVNEKMHELTQDNSSRVVNETAFTKGFYGSRPNDLLQVDASYRKKKQAEFEADRDAYISTKLSDVVTNSVNTKPEDLKQSIQEILTNSKVTSLPLDKRLKVINEALKGIATNGNEEQIDALSDIIIAYDDSGKPVELKDRLPLSEYKSMANKAHVNLNEQKMREFMKNVEGLSSGAITAEFDKLKVKDPLMWKQVAHKLPDIIRSAKAAEARQAKNEKAKNDAIAFDRAATVAFQDKFDADKRGKAFDLYGKDVYDAHFGTDNKKIPDDVIIRECDRMFMQNLHDLPPEEAQEANLKILENKLCKPYLDAMNTRAQKAVEGISSNTEKASEALKYSMALYKASPYTFMSIMKSDIGDKYRALNTLMDIYGEQEGLKRFGRYQEMQTIDKDAFNKMQKGNAYTLADMSSCTINDKSINISPTQNASLYQDVKDLMDVYTASGTMTPESARDLAISEISKSYININGDAIGKKFFSQLNVPNKEVTGEAFLNKLKANAIGATTNILGMDNTPTDKIGAFYERSSNTVHLYVKEDFVHNGTSYKNGKALTSYSAYSFADLFHQDYYAEANAIENQRTKRVTMEDLNPEIDIKMGEELGGD